MTLSRVFISCYNAFAKHGGQALGVSDSVFSGVRVHYVIYFPCSEHIKQIRGDLGFSLILDFIQRSLEKRVTFLIKV